MAIESVNGASAALSSVQQATSQQTNQAQAVDQAARADARHSSAQAQVAENEQVSAEDLEAAINKLNELMQDSQRSLAFSVDKDLDEVVIKVVDTQTEELIRQIPNEEALKFAKNLEGVLGVIFNDMA